jgi:catechol 2,3-dioxygenase-like lactoylglutathione lyase family enzyme
MLDAATATRGIPTTITLDHYGYTVPDLDQAVDFFTRVLGFDLVSLDKQPIAFADDRLARWYGVNPRASVRFAFVRFDGATIEFTEWHSPDQNPIPPSNSDLGGRHVAIAVADVDAAMAYLQQQPGVTVLEKSEWGFAYFTTPWGMTLQIVPFVDRSGLQYGNDTRTP